MLHKRGTCGRSKIRAGPAAVVGIIKPRARASHAAVVGSSRASFAAVVGSSRASFAAVVGNSRASFAAVVGTRADSAVVVGTNRASFAAGVGVNHRTKTHYCTLSCEHIIRDRDSSAAVIGPLAKNSLGPNMPCARVPKSASGR